MTSPKVLISILNWNAVESTCKTVNSVLLSEYKNYSIVLIDNNSSDSSVAILTKAYPDLKLVKNSNNLGYAGAHKIAAKYAIENKFDLIWILNNDVEVLTDSLSELVNAFHRNGDAIFGSVTLEVDMVTISFAGGLEVQAGNKIDGHSKYNKYAGAKIQTLELSERPVSGVEGSSLLIPLNVIKKYGFMDTRYFMYGEETAYSYYLRNKMNIQSIIVPLSRIVHRSGGSFLKSEKLKWVRIYYTTRNGNIVHHKYQKDLIINEMKYSYVLRYMIFFTRHFLFTSKSQMDFNYWCNYYKELGNFHSMLRFKGRYLRPEHFL